jgi:polyisoprenoid-binding protein YceI
MPIKKWKFDMAHSSVGFAVRHMLVSRVRGRFNRWAGELVFDEAVPSATSLAVQIDAASIDTHEPQRDDHLRSRDFFDVERFPQLSFRSTKVERLDERRFQLQGELTLRGVTREVMLDVEYGGRMRDPSGIERVGFSAQTTISRRAFGITFNQILDTGGLALGDKVEVVIEVEAIDEPRRVEPIEEATPDTLAGVDLAAMEVGDGGVGSAPESGRTVALRAAAR